MSKNVTIKIEATMNERWVDDFCSMLKYMQFCGNAGHSAIVAFYADGDGDFRPAFEFDREHTPKYGIRKPECSPEILFDAG